MIRRVASRLISAAAAVAGGAGAAHVLRTIAPYGWERTLEEKGSSLALFQESLTPLVAGTAAAAVVGLALSYERTLRSRKGAVAFAAAGFAGAGAFLGAALRIPISEHDLVSGDAAADAVAIGLVAGGAVLGVGVLLLWEAGNRALWHWLCSVADARGMTGLAVTANRMKILFNPGNRAMLKSVALAEFQGGGRGECEAALRGFYDAGDRDPELLEALCKGASEAKDSAAFLRYLAALQQAVPDDDVLKRAYFDALLEARQVEEALDFALRSRLAEEDEEAQVRIAELLVGREDLPEAVTLARAIGEREGIPFRRSQKILRDVLARREDFTPALNLLAAQAERAAQRDQRIKWLERSLDADPRQQRVRDLLMDVYRSSGMPGKLLRLLERAVEESQERELWMELAETRFAMGQFEETLAELKRFHGVHRPGAKSLLLQGRAQYEVGDHAHAEATLKPLAEDEALDAPSRKAAAEILRRIERARLSAELAELVERAEANQHDTDLQLAASGRLIDSGNADRAMALLDALLGRHPEARPRAVALLRERRDTAPFALLGLLVDLETQGGQLDEALDTARVMVKRSMDPAATLREQTQKILRRSPHHLPTLRELGESCRRDGRFTEMIHYFSLYLGNGGEESAEMLRALMGAYLGLRDLANARRHADRMIEVGAAPDLPQLRQLVALALDENEPEAAAEYLKRIELNDPASAETRELKARVAQGLGNKRFAYLQKELDAGRGGAELLEQLGDIARELGNYNDAIAYYQRASREPSIGRRAKTKLAWVFAKKRLYDVASETLAEISLSLDDDPAEMTQLMDLIYEIASMFHEAHLHDRALKLFKLLLKIDAAYRDVLRRVEALA
jgi:tetratricopeptide (TPR) repeat protein